MNLLKIKTLIITKNNTLKSLKWMEIGEPILLKIIEKLYTSPYLDNSNYLEILGKLILEFNDKGFIEENYLYLIKEEYEVNR